MAVLSGAPALPVVAPRLARVGARLADLVLAFGVAGGYVALGEQIAGYSVPLAVSGWLIPVAYEIGWSLTGGTPGKRLFRLRVVRAAGGRAGGGALVVRAVALFPLYLVCLVNLLVMALDRRAGRALHDLIAGTVVVRAVTGERYEDVVEPSPVVVGLAPAGRRVAARCVDLGVCLVLAVVVAGLLGGGPVWAQVAGVAAFPLAPLAYEVACAFAGGTTLGKALLGLRVVRIGGDRAPLRCLLARAVLCWALALVPMLVGVVVDVMAMVRDERFRRALHDHGHTVVVSGF